MMPFNVIANAVRHVGAAALIATLATASAGTSAIAKDPVPCAERAGAIGVSRIIEVDTKDGILLGNQQYKSVDFLEPGEVVLTFDDGPLRTKTMKVLNALEEHCTKATFFMVGRMALSDPAMVKEIDRRGHTVATHTWSHKNLGRQSQRGAEKEIELGISAISAALGKPVAPFFRFPYLSDPMRMINYLKDRNQGVFSIDVDAFDYRTRSAGRVERTIMKTLEKRGKGILLFHDIQKSTANALRSLLTKLRKGGYKIVHLVPKEPTKTLAKYDKEAQRLQDRRKKAIASRPLAARSIVWPIATPSLLPQPLKNKVTDTPTAKAKDLPWAKKSKPKQTKITPKRRSETKKRRVKKKRYAKPKRAPQPAQNGGDWISNAFSF